MPSWLTSPLSSCVFRGVYEVQARNIRFGVFDGKQSFIGIREKAGRRFLAAELHREADGVFGTVTHMTMLGMLPELIEVRTTVPVGTENGVEVVQPYAPLFWFLTGLEFGRPD